MVRWVTENSLSTWLMTAGYLLTAWAFIASHHSGHKSVQRLTYLAVFPIVLLLSIGTIYKGHSDALDLAARDQELAQTHQKIDRIDFELGNTKAAVLEQGQEQDETHKQIAAIGSAVNKTADEVKVLLNTVPGTAEDIKAQKSVLSDVTKAMQQLLINTKVQPVSAPPKMVQAPTGSNLLPAWGNPASQWYIPAPPNIFTKGGTQMIPSGEVTARDFNPTASGLTPEPNPGSVPPRALTAADLGLTAEPQPKEVVIASGSNAYARPTKSTSGYIGSSSSFNEDDDSNSQPVGCSLKSCDLIGVKPTN